jgi:hypothetical protein
MKKYFLEPFISLKCYVLYVFFFTSAYHSFSQTHGNYIDFSERSGYLKNITSPAMVPSGDFTIEFWFKSCLDTIEHQTFFDNGDHIRTTAFSFAPSNETTYSGCLKENDGSTYCIVSHRYKTDSIGAWHHIAMTYKKVLDEWEMFFDGKKHFFTKKGKQLTNHIQFFLGTNAYLTKPYYGIMDDFRISNQVLYLNDFTPPTNELTALSSTVALYNFNQSDTSTKVYDNSGNGFHLDIVGSVRFKSQDTVSIDSTNNMYSVIGSEGPFQWYNCDLNEIVVGADSSSFKPIISGNYSLQVGYKKCGFQTSCEFYNVDPITSIKVLQVYPNPFYDQLYINRGEYDQLSFRIIDRTGRLVYEGNTEGQITEVDFSKYSRGIYFIVLYDEEIVLSEKVMKL